MRALPKQIQKQVAEADAYLASANPAVPLAPQAETPPAEPEQAPAATEPVVTTDQAPAAPPSAPATASPPADDASKWEARYKTLQGMHNQNIADMKARLKQVEQQNQELAAKLARPVDPPAAQTPDPKDAEVFGTDLVEMVQRVAEQMFGSAAKAFDARIATIEQSLQGTNQAVAQTAEEVFLAQLDKAVPDYATINTDEGFLAWLGEVDAVYGVERQSALTAAANALDVTRVARIFNAYKASIAPVVPAPVAPRSAPSDLNRQIAPSTAAPIRATPTGPRSFTVQEVQSFYHNLQTGKFRGREAEATQYEAAINQALAEGRITG